MNRFASFHRHRRRRIDSILRPACIGTLLLLAQPAFAQGADPGSKGKAIYDKSCASCHSSGFGAFFTGAPKLGAADWKARLEKAGSVDALTASAIKGKGDMPPRGGAGASLSDDDLKITVEYILGQNGQR
ncbi:c-type cytochrome [Nevskia soli]|uniref:c-type cytochrome n=1 Tax=Nevskia soli TaxID=418856 RepID=UPI000689B3FF|nr:c-type cytochrome [Nevskia soli]